MYLLHTNNSQSYQLSNNLSFKYINKRYTFNLQAATTAADEHGVHDSLLPLVFLGSEKKMLPQVAHLSLFKSISAALRTCSRQFKNVLYFTLHTLPCPIRLAEMINIFKKYLKTHSFKKYFKRV